MPSKCLCSSVLISAEDAVLFSSSINNIAFAKSFQNVSGSCFDLVISETSNMHSARSENPIIPMNSFPRKMHIHIIANKIYFREFKTPEVFP